MEPVFTFMTSPNIAYLCAFNWVCFWCSDVLETFICIALNRVVFKALDFSLVHT